MRRRRPEVYAAARRMHRHAPECTRMHPGAPKCPRAKRDWQNEPTAALDGTSRHIVVPRGWRQLAPVDTSWRQCRSTSIWQNEPTAAPDGSFGTSPLGRVRPHATGCNAMQPHATGCNRMQPFGAIWQNEPTAPKNARNPCLAREIQRVYRAHSVRGPAAGPPSLVPPAACLYPHPPHIQ